MFQLFLELEVIFEDHGVCTGAFTDSFVLECAVCEQRALVQSLLTVLKLVNRHKRVDLLIDVAVTYAFPAHTSELSLQIFDLANLWSITRVVFGDLGCVVPSAVLLKFFSFCSPWLISTVVRAAKRRKFVLHRRPFGLTHSTLTNAHKPEKATVVFILEREWFVNVMSREVG